MKGWRELRVVAEILGICITVEDDLPVWSPEVIETLARIASDEAVRVYRQTEIPDVLA